MKRFLCFIFSCLTMVLVGCGLCQNVVKQHLTSPDGKFVSSAFTRDCGATTAYSAQVHLRKAGKKMTDGMGNVYRGDLSGDIQLTWLSPTHLVITSDCAKVLLHQTNFSGITIDRYPKQRGNFGRAVSMESQKNRMRQRD